eukprot:CAMPEP_0181394416 /NCGR_PEP_ID=MMETSP1106-20121128/27769_1 /TAXON_ID=81844 /ORGANISM="Mantoniella antarctica, Strain SL-175" /LENGTH=350 /DNA_ID=CAMNT_0023515917 /DNA_START=267 /DNA_END=1321 /DNA_ORIENTATION=+
MRVRRWGRQPMGSSAAADDAAATTTAALLLGPVVHARGLFRRIVDALLRYVGIVRNVELFPRPDARLRSVTHSLGCALILTNLLDACNNYRHRALREERQSHLHYRKALQCVHVSTLARAVAGAGGDAGDGGGFDGIERAGNVNDGHGHGLVATLAAFLSPVATSACCGIRFATTAAASAAAPAAATADCNVAGAATDSDSNVAATRAADAGGAAAGGAACPATGPTAAAAAVTSFSTTIAMATASFSATATATAAAAAATAFVVAVADAAVSVAAAATSPAASSTMAPPSAIRTSADPTHAAFSFTTPSGKATKLAGCSITLAAASTATAVTTVFFNPPKLSATVFAPL